VPVLDDDTAESLGARVLAAEHQLYPHALSFFASGAVTVSGERFLQHVPRDHGQRLRWIARVSFHPACDCIGSFCVKESGFPAGDLSKCTRNKGENLCCGHPGGFSISPVLFVEEIEPENARRNLRSRWH